MLNDDCCLGPAESQHINVRILLDLSPAFAQSPKPIFSVAWASLVYPSLCAPRLSAWTPLFSVIVSTETAPVADTEDENTRVTRKKSKILANRKLA